MAWFRGFMCRPFGARSNRFILLRGLTAPAKVVLALRASCCMPTGDLVYAAHFAQVNRYPRWLHWPLASDPAVIACTLTMRQGNRSLTPESGTTALAVGELGFSRDVHANTSIGTGQRPVAPKIVTSRWLCRKGANAQTLVCLQSPKRWALLELPIA